MSDRPDYCCGRCPEILGGGYDCTCKGNPRCSNYRPTFRDYLRVILRGLWKGIKLGMGIRPKSSAVKKNTNA